MTNGAQLRLGDHDSLYYEFDPPGRSGRTFVFVNALTGNTGTWQADIGPTLRTVGYGTLAYNFRGQAESTFGPGVMLEQSLVVDDLKRLMREVAPPRPILVGLSIGGLFAAGAVLGGAEVDGLVLINTLRRPGARLEWINAAMLRLAHVGGLRLVMDAYLPLLVNSERAEEVRSDNLVHDPYEPLDPAHGHYQLLAHAAEADWGLPYERLDVPTLIVTGLQDRVFYDPADVAALTTRIPNAETVELADAAHLIPVERPTAVVSAMIAFAEKIGS